MKNRNNKVKCNTEIIFKNLKIQSNQYLRLHKELQKFIKGFIPFFIFMKLKCKAKPKYFNITNVIFLIFLFFFEQLMEL